ncbi:MAG: DUF3429 family protein [Pseudomonadota bacterium]
MAQKDELTNLGLLGVAPFALGAVVAWLSPAILPWSIGAAANQITLVYGAVIASYMAGMGAGGLVAAGNERRAPLLPGMMAALLAWLAAWPGATFLSVGGFFRYSLIIVVLAYLLVRDLTAIRAGDFPNWYAPLRVRLTLWASAFLALAGFRMLIGAF